MKGVMFGVMGVGGVGAVAVMGGGGGPDDFIRHVNKSPQAVYAAFSELGPAGEISMPSVDGWGRRVVQRVVKVPNEQVKLELEVDGEPLITAEVQFAPDGEGTQLAAELDFNKALMNRIMREHDAPTIPTFAFEEFLLDQVFAQAMEEMVNRVEDGRPLLSLAETRSRWGSDGSTRGARPARSSGSSSWERHQAVRPQLDARPTLDPNAAAQRPGSSSRSGY